MLKRDTEVKLILDQQLSSTSSKVGDEMSLTVAEDVVADGRVIVPRGTVLRSTVTHAKPAHENANCTVMSSGVIDFDTPKLLLANGKQVRLDYENQKSRKEDDSRVTPGEVGTLVLASPILIPVVASQYVLLGGFMLFHPQPFLHRQAAAPPCACHDKLENYTFEKGKAFTYFVLRDVTLPAAGFPSAQITTNAPPPLATSSLPGSGR